MQSSTQLLHGLDNGPVWSIQTAFQRLKAQGIAQTEDAAKKWFDELNFFPENITSDALNDEFDRPVKGQITRWEMEQSEARGSLNLVLQLFPLPNGKPCLHVSDFGTARYWVPLTDIEVKTIENGIIDLQNHIGAPITIFAHGELAGRLRGLKSSEDIHYAEHVYLPISPLGKNLFHAQRSENPISSHLSQLEAESIHIIREAVAEAENPAMLYSIGKDSGVMLHLARKAFFPSLPPFPLLHVDTRWKFQEMYQFRDFIARLSRMELLVHTNPEAIEKNINPFDHGSALHTDITKTEGLKQALDKYKFDVVFGGARRDEEKSRAKERIFSFRTATHHWDPKSQRPELWNLFNTKKNPGESIRVFPLSNWTETDIWQYIYQENIPMVPLYFAKPRPVVVRPEMIMLVDDDRCRIEPQEKIEIRKVRFRTLGCYPLTGAVESEAETIEDILLEIINAKNSERQGRKIDTDSAGSMEKKKREGYF